MGTDKQPVRVPRWLWKAVVLLGTLGATAMILSAPSNMSPGGWLAYGLMWASAALIVTYNGDSNE